MQAEAKRLLDAVNVMLDYLDTHEPERLERKGMVEVVAAVCALEQAFADAAVVLSDPDANAPGMARVKGPSTAELAKWAVLPRSGSQRRKVLNALIDAGEEGLTYDELAEKTELFTYSRVGPRLRELRDGGWVEDSGRERPSDLNTPTTVWTLTTVAYERFADGTDSA